MLELLFCALFTVFPDFMIKRYVFNKRWGKEITFYTVWYELRWGITACVIMTIALITLIFYYHPSTTQASSLFRTVTILPESPGRVEEVFVVQHQTVQKGDAIFSLDSSTQKAAVETARHDLATVQAEYLDAQGELERAEGLVLSAQSALAQSQNDYKRYQNIDRDNSGAISQQKLERAKSRIQNIQGELQSLTGTRNQMRARLENILPAKERRAESVLEQALVELEKTIIYAEVSGQIVQLMLQPGDIVNPLIRPAGLLVPDIGASQAIQAGFSQLASPVIQPGTLAEVTCFSKPFTVIPMIVTDVQASISTGQMRPTDQLVDLQDRSKPGTLTVKLEPLYQGGLGGVVPGSKCIANAYTNNHALIISGELNTWEWLFYHMVDTVGIVHALLLRVQTLLIPVKILVFSGH